MKPKLNLKAARKERRFTQSKLAKTLGISTRHYQDLEYGVSEGSVQIWRQLAQILNFTIDHLLKEPKFSPQLELRGKN